MKKTKKKRPLKRVHGYWRVDSRTGVTSYIKQYLRKKAKKPRKRAITPEVISWGGKPTKPRKPKHIKGFHLIHTYHEEAPFERVAYTIRIVALVDFNYQYPMSFNPSDFNGKPRASARHLQYYHTHYFTTPEGAYNDFHEKVPVMRAYGDIHFLDIELLRVSGDGPLSEKHYRIIKEFKEPEDVPGGR